MKFTFTLSQEEFNNAYKLHISQNISKKMTLIILLIGIILFTFSNTNFNDTNSIISTFVAIIIILLASFVFVKILRPKILKNLYEKNTIINDEVIISISNSGLNIQHKFGNQSIAWNGIYKYTYNQDFYLLYTAPNIFYILPTKIMNKQEEEKLKELIL